MRYRSTIILTLVATLAAGCNAGGSSAVCMLSILTPET